MRSLLLTALVSLCLASPVAAQRQPLVFVEQHVRDKLAAAWVDTGTTEVERAYCARYFVGSPYEGQPHYIVTSVEPAITSRATPVSVNFKCPQEPDIVTIHTHPTSSCIQIGRKAIICSPGGLGAHQCFPSPTDLETLAWRGDPFALVQCDKYALVPYAPYRKERFSKREVLGLSMSIAFFTWGVTHALVKK